MVDFVDPNDPAYPLARRLAELLIQHPELSLEEATEKVIREEPHLLPPTPEERRRPN
jgi:hypothetical protein